MKLRFAALVAALAFVFSAASAQTPVIGAGLSNGPNLPATCSPVIGDAYFKTADADPANIGLYECYATDTWRKLGTGAGGGAPTGAQYLVLALSGSLSAERRIVVNAPLTANDGGANGDYEIGCRTANASQSGCLDPGDFSTFDAKIGGSGTTDKIAKFASSGAIGDSAITEDSDSVNFSKKIEVSEIVITGAGAGSWQFNTGTMSVSDASTVRIGAHTGDVFSVSENGGAVTPVIIGTRVNFPNNAPTDDNVFVGNGSAWQVKALADCDDTGGQHLNYDTASNAFSCGTSGGGGGAPTNAQYIVVTADGTLSDERVLTGTANQVIVTDGGAGSTITLSLPQSIATTSNVTFNQITSGNYTSAGNISMLPAQTGTLTICNVSITSGGNNAGTCAFRGGSISGSGTGNPGDINIQPGTISNASNTNPAGDLTIGDADTNGTGRGGQVVIESGGSSNASPGEPGVLATVQAYRDGGTVTTTHTQCFVSGTLSVADCATSATNVLGVSLSTDTSPVRVQTSGFVTVTYDGSYSPTAGWYACSSASVAGQITPQSSACAAGRQVGIVVENGSSVSSGRIQLQRL